MDIEIDADVLDEIGAAVRAEATVGVGGEMGLLGYDETVYVKHSSLLGAESTAVTRILLSRPKDPEPRQRRFLCLLSRTRVVCE